MNAKMNEPSPYPQGNYSPLEGEILPTNTRYGGNKGDSIPKQFFFSFWEESERMTRTKYQETNVHVFMCCDSRKGIQGIPVRGKNLS